MNDTKTEPVSEWSRSRLQRHKRILEQKQAEIQGRIDAIDQVLQERDADAE